MSLRRPSPGDPPPAGGFRHLLRVRYPECDPQGIVFNARYGEWADLATTELARAIDPAWILPGGAIEYRLRHQSTEWRAPARFDDVVEARPVVVHVGGTSFRVETPFHRWPDGLLLATTTTTYVLVADGRKVEVSDEVRTRLLGGAPGRVADHAGVGGGRVVAHHPWSARRTMPWKNGGGITHELHRDDELRLSVAEVATPGPFSVFPGIDRVLTVLTGACTLTRGELRVDLEPLRPFVFHGEDPWTCTAVAASTLDFNVMVPRGRPAAVRATRGCLVDADWLLVLEPGHVGGVPVGRLDLVRLEGPVVAPAGLGLHLGASLLGLAGP